MSADIPAVSLKPFASNASRRGTTSVTVRCGSISTQDIAIATIAEPTSTSPTMPKSVRKPSDRLPVTSCGICRSPAFPPSGVRRFEDDAFRSYGALAGRDALHSAVRHRRSAHHGAGRVHVAIRHERAVRLFQLF